MKKHLIAAAVAAAVAAPAMAQVSISGTIDVGVRSQKPQVGESGIAIANSAISTSHIALTGSEDLGNGLRASFHLNGGVTPGTGGLGGNAAAGTQTAIFSRESSVSLSGAFGSVTIGRTDVSQAEGVDTFAGGGNFGNMSFFSSASNALELGNDAANTVRYQLPTLVKGLTVQIGRGTLDGVSSTDVDGISLSYVDGNLGLIVGKDMVDGANPSDYTAFGVRYNFGMVSVGYAQGKRDFENAATDITNTALSARVPLSNGFALHAVNQSRKLEATGVTGKSNAFGVSKALSKRTTLYGIYEDTKNLALRSPVGDWFQVSVIHNF